MGERHDALADATHQAKWLVNILANERVYGAADKDQLELELKSDE